ncbi:putative gibberellin 2-beta-dioxygenase [Helianthus annuus]|nr:putative gibberellin 2-beta-dioxygenase [Helianthus annuus]
MILNLFSRIHDIYVAPLCAVDDYVTAVKNMACKILEMMADELNLEDRNVVDG